MDLIRYYSVGRRVGRKVRGLGKSLRGVTVKEYTDRSLLHHPFSPRPLGPNVTGKKSKHRTTDTRAMNYRDMESKEEVFYSQYY